MSSRMGRRAVLGGMAGVGIAGAGGLALRAWSNGVFAAEQGPAYQPWRDRLGGETADGLKDIVAAGILASNAHNTQPWFFRVSGQSIEVRADHARHLGSFDPFRREMVLSLGCAIENMCVTARALGYAVSVELPPARLGLGERPDTGAVAILHLAEGEGGDTELFEAIARRHTHRGAYDLERPVPVGLQEEMMRIASGEAEIELMLLEGGARKEELGDLVVSATEQIIADPVMAADSARWFRFDWRAINEHRDGVTLDAAALSPLINVAAKILPAPSAESSDRQWLEATRNVHIPTAPLLGIVAVPDLYDQPMAIRAGMVWQRLHLWATSRGLVAQPLNQPAEIVDRQAELGQRPAMAEALSQITGERSLGPTFLFRMGYASRPARLSPRRPVGDVLLAS